MSARTVYLTRLIGLFVLIASLAAILHKASFVGSFSAIVHDQPVVLVLGMITLASGLAVILAHNIWSGGAAPVIVTIFGWLTAVRGALLLFLPPAALEALFNAVRVDEFFYVYIGIALVIAAYLTYAGFRNTAAANVRP